MELSKRLRAVADLVTSGSRLADIGTDHAYIPIYLTEKGILSGAVAADVNEGPLKRAEANIREHGLEGKINTRISDGFSALEAGEADSAVIAGMGGSLVIRILSEGRHVVSGLRECILQPQSEIEKVRAFLLEEGFFFLREDMVEEDGKYYPMMKVMPPERNEGSREENPEWNETELRYGKLLLEQKNPVLREYLKKEIRIRTQIIDSLSGQSSKRAKERMEEIKQELACAGKGMNYYVMQ